MNKLSLNKLSLKKSSKGEGSPIKLPKGLKVNQLALGVVIVILLALTIYFAFSYFQGVNTKDNLVSDISKREGEIAANPPVNLYDLRAKRDDAVANLSKNAPFLKSIDDTELATQLLAISRDANKPDFKFLPSSGNTSITINNSTYPVKSYDIAFGSTTTLPKAIYLLKLLEDLPYDTSRITAIETTKSTSSSDSWSLSLKFEVVLRNP